MSVVAPLSRSAGPKEQLVAMLERNKSQLAAALPKHVTPERMSRLALSVFSSSKQLQQCEVASIYGAVILASQLGLEIGVGGQAYIIPYKDRRNNVMKAQFVPGWQGIVDLVSRTGRAAVWTGAVFEGDHFDYALGDRPFVTHRPEGESDPEKLVFAYAVGRVNGSEWPVIEVWSAARLRKHFNRMNKQGEKHYAHENWEMYCRKIPLLQVCKYMPKSVELTAALAAETSAETGRGMTFDGQFTTLDDGDSDGGPDPTTASTPRSSSASDNGAANDAPAPGAGAPPAASTPKSSAGPISKGQIGLIRNLAGKAGKDDAAICAHAKIEALESATAAQGVEIINWLQAQQSAE